VRKVIAVTAIIMAGWVGPVSGQAANGASHGKARLPVALGAPGDAAAAVVVAPKVLENWSFLYRHITEVEFVLCLEGRNEEGVVYIDDFRLARMEEATASSVRYHPCEGERYIGTAHNHPPVEGAAPLCYRSQPDRRSFEMDARAVVDIVLCGTERFVWVLKDGRAGSVE
jgi:hypothetical protein